jgi:hypothetical protein
MRARNGESDRKRGEEALKALNEESVLMRGTVVAPSSSSESYLPTKSRAAAHKCVPNQQYDNERASMPCPLACSLRIAP